jgi:polysaccharide biosynthesis protein PslG
MKRALFCFTACLPLLATAQIPEPVLSQGVGVNIHFVTGHERDLDLIAAAGFKFIRMDFGWEGTEKARGEYNWSGYDELTANLSKRGVRPLYILDYSHRLYEDRVETTNPISRKVERNTASPRKPESVAAFAKWAGAAAAHFKGRGVIWEIWNEPNISFWKPKPNVDDYITLALATCKAIRAADPQATIIGPAISRFDPAFMDKFLASGVLESLDGVSVHPYRQKRGPETATAEYARLREAIDRESPAAKKGKLPIISGEWGYSTDGKDVSPELQAAFIARQQLFNLFTGVPLSIWYDWKNDGPDRSEREHNFGTVTEDLKPKPAYLAMQTLTRELAGFRITGRRATGSDEDYVIELSNQDGVMKLAAWTTGQPHAVTLTMDSAKPLQLVSGSGETSEIKTANGKLVLDLTATPQYVTVGKR